jgi:hypothetical protein
LAVTGRTVRDAIDDGMAAAGIEESPTVRLEFTDGVITNITSDNHPALGRPAEDIQSLSFISGAEAG